jgi:CHASE3 domain sensor protein
VQLSIGTRLVGGFLVLAALIGGISWMALSGLREVSRAYERATDEYARRALVELELQVALLDQVRAEKNYLLRGEAVYLEEVRRLGTRVRSARAKLASASLPPEEVEVLRRVDAAIENLDRSFEAGIPMRGAAGIEAADATLRGKAAAIVTDLDQLAQSAGRRAEEARLSAVAQARSTLS